MFEFPKICRFCTKSTALKYDLEDKASSLIKKLTAIAPNTIELSVLLPKKICQLCCDKLNETYNFQQQIYKAFNMYKKIADYQNLIEDNKKEGTQTAPFEYPDEDFISDDLKYFLDNLGKFTAQVNETFIKCRNDQFNLENFSPISARKNENVVRRKRGRPRKYCNMLNLKNDDLTDVEKMKNAVVNSLPNIDPDYEPEELVINLRKKRGRPKRNLKQESFVEIEEPSSSKQSNEMAEETKEKNKKITRIGAIQSDTDPYEYTYHLPYDKNVSVNYISNPTDKFFFCKNCNKQYCDFSSLRKHFVHHSTIKIFQCNLCDYETYTKHCLDSHQIVHVEARPETCPECGKTFKSKDRLHRHSYCHVKRFICHICGKEFSHSAMLKKHVHHIHINERNFVCAVCGFAAKSQDYLNRHMTRHDDSDENKIPCPVCKKLLKTRNSFKIHMKRHDDDRRFECSLCDKKYVLKSQLDIHFRIHTGFKPFVCRFCGKQFRKADPFKNHVRIHTNEKPFVCDFCNKKFTQKVSLQVHIRLHTGERPFKCKECDKSFVQGSVYKLHMKRYHPVA